MSAPSDPTSTASPSPRQSRLGASLGVLAALAAAALLGGGAALAGAMALGAFDDPTPAPVQTAVEATSAPPAAEGERLTPGEIYRRASSGVVQVTTSGARGGGLGSGFVIDQQGHIVTNFHVIDGADAIEVSFSNKDTLDARLVGSDPSTDLALLEVDAGAGALTPLVLADSDRVQVGDPVVAIGNPFGLERTVTAGIVSALQRAVSAPNGYTIDQVIQTDAPINPGNSGGPLLDGRGQVIGVNSQIETAGGSSGNVGIGFAVPSNTVKTVVGQLLEDGSVDRSYLGVTLAEANEGLVADLGLAQPGVLVQSVQPGSPAAAAGLRGGSEPKVVSGESYVLGGDLIVAVDGVSVSTIAGIRAELMKRDPGETVTLDVVRDGVTKTIRVELGRQPESLTG